MAPKSYVSPDPVNMTLFGKRVFADSQGMDVDMRSSWITQGSPKSNDRCPYERQKRKKTERRLGGD